MGKSYRDLLVWQRSKKLVSAVYTITQTFPREEIYGLTNQIRRAAVSIPSNIAEGQGRTTPGSFRLFLGHARGSLYELITQLEIAIDLTYAEAKRTQPLLDEAAQIGRMLNALMVAVERPTASVSKSQF